VTVAALGWLVSASVDAPVQRGAAWIVLGYLALALSEVVPPFVPTLLLLTATPLMLGGFAPRFSLAEVLTWPADPVLALFGGGLALGLAAQRHGIDAAMAQAVLRISRGDRRALLVLVSFGTAALSMWMSNIAAAAMILAALRPIPALREEAGFRRALLLGVAMGANLGGMGTPIGSGPNALAIAAANPYHRVTFLDWMFFALPLVGAMLVLVVVLLALGYRVRGRFEPAFGATPVIGARFIAVVVVFACAVAAWLCEPLHGVSAPLVGLCVMLVLFATGLLERTDIGRLDWSTLGLIAGGVSLGKLIESAGLLTPLSSLDWHAWPQFIWLGGLVVASALMSALMSNTATAALLIPLGLSVQASPSVAIVIAIGASFGIPFAISTPPNAMAYGEGGLRSIDLLRVGACVMLLGCALVATTGLAVLRALGIP
jgi:sodium-dependent dicarboxylate transporter 2/3/5